MTAVTTRFAFSPVPQRLRHARRGAVGVAISLVLAMVVLGCGGEDSPVVDGTTVSGVVVDVQGTLTELEQFTLVLEDGSRLTVTPEAGVLEGSGFSPAHIREHSALVEPISITYREVDGQNMVVGIDDAGA